MTVAETIEATGMSLDDCLLLARISPDKYTSLSEDVPEIPLYFKLKRIKYKEKLLKVLNTQAAEHGDVKIAMYLLEANFTEEYNAGAKKDAMKKSAKTAETDMEQLMDRVRKASLMPIDEANTVSDIQIEAEKATYELSHLVSDGQ
jgi:DNA-binding protein YbaB